MQSPTHWCLKERPAHIPIQSNARLNLLTLTCSVVCLPPQAYSNKFRVAALEASVFHFPLVPWSAAERNGHTHGSFYLTLSTPSRHGGVLFSEIVFLVRAAFMAARARLRFPQNLKKSQLPYGQPSRTPLQANPQPGYQEMYIQPQKLAHKMCAQSEISLIFVISIDCSGSAKIAK